MIHNGTICGWPPNAVSMKTRRSIGRNLGKELSAKSPKPENCLMYQTYCRSPGAKASYVLFLAHSRNSQYRSWRVRRFGGSIGRNLGKELSAKSPKPENCLMYQTY